MLFYDDISEILDDIILSQMDVSACRSLLDSLFPYGYHSVNSGCFDVRKEIIVNGNGDYHITAYDLPYIDTCEKLVKFESNYEGAYPIMFAMLDGMDGKSDYIACSLIKIFSCVYGDPALMIFISGERVAFGTVRSERQVEDNFCISDWFLPADFDTRISFVEDAYSLSDVIGWIKDNSQLEKTKTYSKKKNRKTSSKMQSWNYDCHDFSLDYIHALSEFQYYTGVSTERQRHEYYLAFDDETGENHSAMIDEEENVSMGYTFDDVASEITYVGNVTHFEELDEYSDDLETSEINGTAVAEPDYHDSFDSLDFDENIPDDVLNDPEKLLKYLGGNIPKRQMKPIQKEKKVEPEQITFDSLKTPALVANNAPEEKPIADVRKVEPIDCSWLEEPLTEESQKADTAVDEVLKGKPLADVVQDLETLVSDLFDDTPIQGDIPESEPETNDIPEDKPFSDVVQDLESAVNGLFDEELVLDEIQQLESASDDVTDDAFVADENQKSEAIVGDESEYDEFQEPDNIVSLQPEEQPVIDEVQEHESVTSNVSVEKSAIDEIQEADTVSDDVTDDAFVADENQKSEAFVGDEPEEDEIQEPDNIVSLQPEEQPVIDEVQEHESVTSNVSVEKSAIDEIQEADTVSDDVTDDAFVADENQKSEAFVGDEPEEDEIQEPDNIVSLQPEEQPVIDKVQKTESVTSNVSAREPAIDEIKNSGKAVNNVDDGKSVDDTSGMISHFELISMVNVHSETVFRYIHEHKIIPDRVIQSGSRVKYFFSRDNVQEIIKKYDWHIISESNKRRVFLQMINKMTMSFSYKPVFIKAFFATAQNGKTSMSKIVAYFRDFYESRRRAGLFVEKPNSIFANSGYSDKDVKKLILVYPYKRFAEMQMFTYSKLFGTVSMDPTVWSSLHSSEIIEICRMCDEHIETYYLRLNSKNPQSVDDCGFAVLSNIITISSIHLFILQIDVTVVKISRLFMSDFNSWH